MAHDLIKLLSFDLYPCDVKVITCHQYHTLHIEKGSWCYEIPIIYFASGKSMFNMCNSKALCGLLRKDIHFCFYYSL